MKTLYLLPLLLLPLFAPGCATLDKWILPTATSTNEVSIPIAPDAEPLVIRAEVLARTSRDIVNAFVMFVNTNQTILSQSATGAGMIQIKDQLVQEFPPAWRDFRMFTKLYKENRTQGNRDLLGNSLEGIRTLVTMAEVHLAGGGALSCGVTDSDSTNHSGTAAVSAAES